jgi:hypothetical protein
MTNCIKAVSPGEVPASKNNEVPDHCSSQRSRSSSHRTVHENLYSDAHIQRTVDLRRLVERVLAVPLHCELLCVDDRSTYGSRESSSKYNILTLGFSGARRRPLVHDGRSISCSSLYGSQVCELNGLHLVVVPAHEEGRIPVARNTETGNFGLDHECRCKPSGNRGAPQMGSR